MGTDHPRVLGGTEFNGLTYVGAEAELLAYVRERIAHYKCPRSIDFEAELPRLPTGKLYKRLLKDLYSKAAG